MYCHDDNIDVCLEELIMFRASYPHDVYKERYLWWWTINPPLNIEVVSF